MKSSAKQRLDAASKRLAARLSGVRAKAMRLMEQGEGRERSAALERIKKDIHDRNA